MAPEHIERAFRTANYVSLGIAVAIAAVLALTVSWYVTRRLQAPLTALGRAATRVARGDYDTRAVRDFGPELETLAGSFNTMAARLSSTEKTRRRLLADLAHELRTPLQLSGRTWEAWDDGVRSWDETTRDVLGDQVVRLARLAEDLDAVSRAEEGRLVLSRDAVPVTSCSVPPLMALPGGSMTSASGLRYSPVSRSSFSWIEPDSCRC